MTCSERWAKMPLVQNYRLLRGNCKITVQFELIFSIANTLCTFYLSLYMKARGLSNGEIGLLVALGYVAGMVCSLFAGEIVNRLGRKRSVFIFELLAWALSSFLYVFADRFWLFAAAKLVGSLQQISAVGGVMAAATLAAGLLLVPRINRRVKTLEQVAVVLASGISIQIPFQLMMIYAPRKNLTYACFAIVLYALGWSCIQTYLDLLMVEPPTEPFEEERSGIYASINLLISAASMAMASVSGFLYLLEPALLFWACIVLLALCLAGLLFVYTRSRHSRTELQKQTTQEETEL